MVKETERVRERDRKKKLDMMFFSSKELYDSVGERKFFWPDRTEKREYRCRALCVNVLLVIACDLLSISHTLTILQMHMSSNIEVYYISDRNILDIDHWHQSHSTSNI